MKTAGAAVLTVLKKRRRFIAMNFEEVVIKVETEHYELQDEEDVDEETSSFSVHGYSEENDNSDGRLGEGQQEVSFCDMNRRKPGEDSWVCRQGFSSRSSSSDEHETDSTGLMPFVMGEEGGKWRPVCSRCNKSFSNKGHLKQHVLSVHKGQRYPCEICDKSFSVKADLKRHILSVHEGQRYPCDICEKNFSKKGHLKLHISSVHEGKRYFCHICNKKSFSDRSTLRKHILVHGGKRHFCDLCKKSFSEKRVLNRHIKSIHKSQV